MKRTLALLCGLAALAPAPPSIETYRVTLPEGGLPEYWSVTLPAVEGAIARAEIDLELRPWAVVRLENTTDEAPWPTLRPWARALAWPEVEVWRGVERLHRERLEVSVTTKTVGLVYDGQLDHGGDSGSSVTGTGRSVGGPTAIEPGLLAGGLQVEVVAPADVALIVFGTNQFDLSAGVYLGGAVVLRIER